MIKSSANEEYYSIKEVAELLKVAYLTVYRWIQAGKVPAYQVGKQYRVKKVDYEAYIKSNKVKVKQ